MTPVSYFDLIVSKGIVSKTILLRNVTFNEVPLTDAVTTFDSGTRYTIGTHRSSPISRSS
jgi:hypothetical protein